MSPEQIERIELELGWDCIEEESDTKTTHYTFMRPIEKGDSIVFIEYSWSTKYKVCARDINSWVPFRDFRKMYNYLKEV